MISSEEAIKLILSRVPSVKTETVSVDDCLGRILRQSIHAERDAPPFNRVMMDGYAVDSSSLSRRRWEIEGIALAGHEPPALARTTGCIEVTTGCILPGGCDTVIPVEECVVTATGMDLTSESQVHPGQYIHSMGSDNRAGDCILVPGIRLTPAELAVLATEGITSLEVAKQPRIGLVTTGDEVIIDGSKPSRTQIRGSHCQALTGLFSQFPGLPFIHRHSRDDRDDLRDALSVYLDCADILLITGGVSMGRKDVIPELLEELGVEKILHRVAQRPGKPLWVGYKDNKLVFGLPGNPISALICARRYVFPVIEKMMDAAGIGALRLALQNNVDPLEKMTRFVPVRLTDEGVLAEPFATSGSLQNLAGTSGFVEVPPKEISTQVYNYYSWTSR